MSNIVDLWIKNQHELFGHNQTQALECLNDALLTNHAPHRLSEWKQERRRLPLEIANYMMPEAVGYAHRHNLSTGLIRLPVPAKE